MKYAMPSIWKIKNNNKKKADEKRTDAVSSLITVWRVKETKAKTVLFTTLEIKEWTQGCLIQICLSTCEPWASRAKKKKIDERNLKVMSTTAECDLWIHSNDPGCQSIPGGTRSNTPCCWVSGPVHPAYCLLPPLGDSQRNPNSTANIT